MRASSSLVAAVAASAAAAGSMTRRTVSSERKNSPSGTLLSVQYSTSGSSMCQSSRGLTTLPTRGFDTTSPLATSTRVASRRTGRLTP
jgi:hypothetical protein